MADDNTTVHPVRPEKRRRRGSEPVVEVLEGDLRGQVFAVSGALLIGKGRGADIDLPDTGVSRKHAKLVVNADGSVNVLDLASTNGTSVNGTNVDLTTLREGDQIGIGPQAVLRFGYRAVAEPATSTGSDVQLSARQLEVGRLVAAGLTNAEIADRLGVKPRTVTSHLDHIYARLGIGSRAALARIIVESGQLED